MKALVKDQPAKGLTLKDIPVPVVGADEVLIKTRKMAICGTDLHIYQWDEWSQNNVNVPAVIGHEFVGNVVEKGKNVTGFEIGDRVSGEGHITCGQCRNCLGGRRHLCIHTVGIGYHRDGSFAEYLVLPAKNAFHVPEVISDDIASIFDPLGNATHTALSFDMVGEDVLITGAGPIGIMAAAIARHVGARNIVITDINDYRLDLARKVGGATRAINVQKESLDDVMKELRIKSGFDVAMEMSGSLHAMEDIIKHIYHGGRIALLGILPNDGKIKWHDIIFKMITIKGIYGREIFETWYKMCSMVESGLDVSQVITHQFLFEDYKKAFEVMLSGQAGKVILNWE
jgi:threonine 3-dehydrogenase